MAFGALSSAERELQFPLSFAQQRLWFMYNLEPDMPAYNIPLSVRLRGALNIDALKLSLNRLEKRHEALRTRFEEIDGQPMQIICSARPKMLPVIDLEPVSQGRRESLISQLAEQDEQRTFKLEEGRLFRVTLLRLSEQEHILLCVMHHIVSDAWSMGVLMREMTQLYEAYSKGERSPLNELDIQYVDFAVWQRKWLQGDALQKKLDYWKKQLAGVPPVLELATDRPRPPAQSYKGAKTKIELNKEMGPKLERICREERASLFMVLLAGFKMLLSRYSGKQDIATGISVAGRSRKELEGLIGFFINTLVLRTEVKGEDSFRKLLEKVRDVTLEGYAHQDVPFEKLVEELEPERSMSHTPLFQVLFEFENKARKAIDVQGLKMEELTVASRTSKFDLTLEITESEDGLVAAMEYSTDLYDAETIEAMLKHYSHLLEGALTEPDKSIGELEFLGAEEKTQLLEQWNDTRRAYPQNIYMAEMFEQQAEKRPNAVAIIYEDQTISYGDLNRKSNCLARYLIEKGVGADMPVGICMDRGIDMVVGLLGILKAGGAYMPLDETYPKERLAFMAQDAGVKVAVTKGGAARVLPEFIDEVVELDKDWGEISSRSEDNLDVKAEANNLAYVIYTSGSTGTPKGVQITQSGITNFLRSMLEAPGLSAEDVLLTVTRLSFDISTMDLMLPLIVGAQVVIVSREDARDGAKLTQILDQSGATMMQATPVTWRMLVEAGWKGSDKLRVISAGEPLLPGLAQDLIDRSAALWDLYGPTEISIYATLHKVEDSNVNVIPVGRPIANTQVYILDERQRLAPIGAVGELHIGGDGLARGYMSSSDLTAERFVPDQYGKTTGGRLYKSGDLARYRRDGNIELVGRKDHQVKVRGYRIELGEIEAQIMNEEAIKQAAVAVREEENRGKILVAYVTEKESEEVNEFDLLNRLRDKLPEYMIPAAVVKLTEMPISANGKIDRARLPVFEWSAGQGAKEYAEPRNSIETVLAVIWRDVLKVKQVGIYDNFFELGGHSLMGTQVISALRASFEIELPLRTLFEAPTIEQMALKVFEALTQDENDEVLNELLTEMEE